MSTPIDFSWEGSENPDDPSGIATLRCNGVCATVRLNDFATASRLSYLLGAVYQLGWSNAIDRAILTTSKLLNEQRYD